MNCFLSKVRFEIKWKGKIVAHRALPSARCAHNTVVGLVRIQMEHEVMTNGITMSVSLPFSSILS